MDEIGLAAGSISWTTDVVRAFLGLYGRAPERLAVEPLPSWWCNTVLRVETDGEQLVLRRYGLALEGRAGSWPSSCTWAPTPSPRSRR